VSTSVELRHATAVFTGIAEGDLGRTTGEPDAAVVANRAGLLENLGLSGVLVPAQVHGAGVVQAAEAAGYRVGGVEADALVTAAPSQALAVHVADCLPIVVAGAGGLAVIHAGWRGLAGGVIESAVERLRALTGEEPLEAVVGPGAGGCCYEAGPEVHAALAGYGASTGRLIDLRSVARAKLAACGVASIGAVELCTLCAPPGLLFSYRRDGPQTGRQAGIAWLR
jgi:YfiH family protein